MVKLSERYDREGNTDKTKFGLNNINHLSVVRLLIFRKVKYKFSCLLTGPNENPSSDGYIIYGSWQNDIPEESMYPIQCRGRSHNYSLSAKVVRDTYSDYFLNEGTFPWHLNLV